MNNRQIELLNSQFFISFILSITLLMSFLLTYNEKQKLLNKKMIFTTGSSQYVNLLNRILFTLILFYNLYINYEQYQLEKEKKSDLSPFRNQIYATILNILSALIILYVIYQTWNTSNETASIENTI